MFHANEMVAKISKCVWSGGGYSIWLGSLTTGETFYRVCEFGKDAVDFATLEEASSALLVAAT